MPTQTFQVVRSAFEITADDELHGRLRALYEKFPPPDPAAPRILFEWKGSQCAWHAADGSPRRTRVDDPARRAAVMASLLAQVISRLYPEYPVLHGNALRSRLGTGVVLLVGAAGTGKTTLTRELAQQSPAAWEPVAEDVLAIDPEGQLLFPYPRALSIRREGSHPDVPAKDLVPHPATVGDPVHLAKARVFVLCREAPSEVPSSDFDEEIELAWLTHGSEALHDALKEAGLPVIGFRQQSGLTRVEYMRRLEQKEKEAQARVLDAHGALILATGRSSRDGSRKAAVRPSRPKLQSISSGDGVRHCLPHLVRPTVEAAGTPGGRHFLRLAKAFSTAAFFLLIPGGTPRDTAWALAEATMP